MMSRWHDIQKWTVTFNYIRTVLTLPLDVVLWGCSTRYVELNYFESSLSKSYCHSPDLEHCSKLKDLWTLLVPHDFFCILWKRDFVLFYLFSLDQPPFQVTKRFRFLLYSSSFPAGWLRIIPLSALCNYIFNILISRGRLLQPMAKQFWHMQKKNNTSRL
jgi:hypothetical protein